MPARRRAPTPLASEGRHRALNYNGSVDPTSLERLLREVAAGALTPEQASRRLRHLPFEDLGFARVDHHRPLRQGAAEVILAQGKTPAEIASIAVALAKNVPNLLITRADPAAYRAVRRRLRAAQYHPRSRAILLQRDRKKTGKGEVLVLSAGTGDIPVAEEAVLTATMMGSRVRAIYDVGVAGLHRLLAERENLAAARVIVVAAGMEGALPSVVGGLVSVPVIAVPTSIGYGSNLGGLTAMLGMLNSCAPNVLVVNVDNGFGAGYAAALINRL